MPNAARLCAGVWRKATGLTGGAGMSPGALSLFGEFAPLLAA